MGHKVSPTGLRIGVYKDWNSRWFADKKDYAVFLNEDLKIRKYLEASVADAQVSHIEIERIKTDKGTNVHIILYVGRAGVVHGQDGARVNALVKELKKIVKSGVVNLTVQQVTNPDLDAKLVALSIAKQLEERVSFRIAQKKAIQRVRKAGAKGIKTMVSGRLGGAEIARSEGYKEGTVPLHTLRADIDFAKAEAVTTYGRLGVKVWICRGEYDLQIPEVAEDEGE